MLKLEQPQSEPKNNRIASSIKLNQISHSALLSGILTMTMLPLAGLAQTPEPPESGPTEEVVEPSRFDCELYEGQYTVVYRPASQPGQAYPWAQPGEMGGGWTAERRCVAISERLEQYRPEGLTELRTGVENGYNTVCATTEQSGGGCSIVFTVPPGQDPIATRDAVFENLTLADSGVSTNAVNTFAGNNNGIAGQIGDLLGSSLPTALGGWNTIDGSTGIDLKPYLDPSDGGTGANLTHPASGHRLNPDNFR